MKSRLLAMMVLCLVMASGGLAATVVVTPSTPNGWGFLQETPTGSGAFVNGPSTPPLGSGSAELTVDSTGGVIVGAAMYSGTPLADITNLEYSTYRTSGAPALAIALQFNFDADLTDLNEGWQGRMTYEPYHTYTVSDATWETWDPMDDAANGNWWFSGAPGNAVCPQANPCTWTEVLGHFPNGGIHNTFGAVIFKAGGGWTGGFVGSVDAFTIGIEGVDTTYDFEASFANTGEILTPQSGEVVFGTYDFTATYNDGDDVNDDGVQWAIRHDNCNAGGNTDWGNVNGHSDPYDWDGANFLTTFDTSSVAPGDYCFVFNPTDDGGQNDVRETQLFWIGDLSATPLIAYNPVGTEHEVSADIGVDVAGVEILFVVEGVNSESETVLTNAEGVASFTYEGGMSPGEDTITVCVDEDGSLTCDENEPAVVLTKYWLEHYVTGGGNIREFETITKGKKSMEVTSAFATFGGTVGFDLQGEPTGNWQIVLHDVDGTVFDRGNFHATEITELELLNRADCPDAESPVADYNIAKFRADGRFNGEDGWSVFVRVSDFGEGNDAADGIRVTLEGPNAEYYDTYESGDFPDDESEVCTGSARNLIEGGNIQIHPPMEPEV